MGAGILGIERAFTITQAGNKGSAGIGAEDPTAGLGALGAFGDAGQFSTQGGVLTVFSL